jgi:serine/threonine-protein kinase
MTASQIGSYRIVREIGRGAMGVVLEARDEQEAVVALKLLSLPTALPEAETASLRARFLREGRALSAVSHPNVVRVFQAGEAEGHFFLAMEFLDGESLRQLLARSGPLAPERVIEIGVQLLHALEAVHRAGIIHRDVKPENVVVLHTGEVKLADFGVVWMQNEATLTRTGGMLGSPAYMSPEQILARPIDPRSDQFSAAAALYQLLTDRLPFPGAGLMELAQKVVHGEPDPLPDHIPPALRLAIGRALRKLPEERFATASDFADALQATSPEVLAWAPAAPVTPAPVVASPPELTVVDAGSRCNRHRGRPAIARCAACGKGVCRQCTRQEHAPYYCMVHAPVTLFGVSLVRLEVALVLLLFLLLLFGVGPLGRAIFQH